MRSLLLFSLLALAACQREAAPIRQLLQPYAADIQSFTVKTGRDTVLLCKNGTRLRVCANTFVTTDPEVRVEVKEVFTRAQMMAEGLSTVTTDGRVLESAGMLWLKVGPKINPACPIQAELPPERRLELPVSLFEGVTDGTTTRWQNPRPPVNDSAWQQVERGRVLFCNYCANCHDQGLRYGQTGPALGNIGQVRTRPWLLEFTRNPGRMIEQGDPIARQVWTCYQPALMNGFENLPEGDIQAIYDWIEAESARQGWQGRPDTACLVKTPRPNSALNVRFLAFPLLQQGWYNFDYYPNDIPASLAVHVQDLEAYDEVSVLLVYERFNVQIELNRYGNEFGSWPNRQSSLLPEAARVVAFGVKDQDFYMANVPVAIAEHNEFTLKLARSEPPKPALQSKQTIPTPDAQLWEQWNQLPPARVVDCGFGHAEG